MPWFSCTYKTVIYVSWCVAGLAWKLDCLYFNWHLCSTLANYLPSVSIIIVHVVGKRTDHVLHVAHLSLAVVVLLWWFLAKLFAVVPFLVSLEAFHERRHALIARLDVGGEREASCVYSQAAHLALRRFVRLVHLTYIIIVCQLFVLFLHQLVIYRTSKL